MPELPEVDTIVSGLKKKFLNQKILDLKSDLFKNLDIKNEIIKDVKRHGKYIFLILTNNKAVVVHLRMTGQILIDANLDKHCHLEIFFENSRLVYRDIRKFGRWEMIKADQIDEYISAKKLASDALIITFEEFWQNLKNKPLKQQLLDQTVIAGLGNIYVDEVLNRAKLSPKRISVTKKEAQNLLKIIKEVLLEAIKQKGTTFSDYVDINNQKGQFQNFLRAYKQVGKDCHNCGAKIIKDKIAGRGTYYCLNCQK